MIYKVTNWEELCRLVSSLKDKEESISLIADTKNEENGDIREMFFKVTNTNSDVPYSRLQEDGCQEMERWNT